MIERLTFWLGEDADAIWQAHLEVVERDAEAMRHMDEANDE